MTLLDNLDRLADERGILPTRFRCPRYDACDRSTGDKMRKGAGCMLSHVGPLYEACGGQTPRLAVVGMDHRDSIAGNYTERTGDILFRYVRADGHRDKFNPHYKGVVRTAASFLGSVGRSCDDGCWRQRRCRKSCDPAVDDCVIERIAQPNLVKCVPEVSNGTSVTTGVMRSNCTPHLLAEFRAYGPTICVFHGSKSRWHVLDALGREGLLVEPLPIATRKSDIAFSVPGLGTKMFFFHHPSRNSLAAQWDADVVPCLDYLRREGEFD